MGGSFTLPKARPWPKSGTIYRPAAMIRIDGNTFMIFSDGSFWSPCYAWNTELKRVGGRNWLFKTFAPGALQALLKTKVISKSVYDAAMEQRELHRKRYEARNDLHQIRELNEKHKLGISKAAFDALKAVAREGDDE